jgi:hypothetical protein
LKKYLEDHRCGGANVLDFTSRTITGEPGALSSIRKNGEDEPYSNIEFFYKKISFLNLEHTQFQYSIVKGQDDRYGAHSARSTFAGALGSMLSFESLTKLSLKFANFAISSTDDTVQRQVSSGNSTFAYVNFPKLKSIDMSNSI